MKNPLLPTKLHQPAPPSKRVQRPHLVGRLSRGLDSEHALTLISAPAGFGKTVCVSEWISSLGLPVAWLSLDRSDDNPARFFRYLIAALQGVSAPLGSDLEAALSGGQTPPPEVVASTLIGDILEVEERFLLVLDDFHLIQDPAILSVVNALIHSGAQTLHTVLVTREDPPLPLARLRANNRMTEIRASDLRFHREEVGRFMQELMDLPLSEQDIHTLEERTEGWIVGVQLAGLSLRGRPDPSHFIANLSGSHRYILSYLTEEVLGSQPQDVQTFLLQTSILDKLTGDLCDAVTGRNDSHEMLERLYNANLFLIPLDDDGLWYRYHHLFADLLRIQGRRAPKEQTNELHQRASAWYEAAGMILEAIDHRLASSDFAQAVRLLEQHTIRLVTQGYTRTLEGWMAAIPAEWQTRSARLNIAYAWLHLLRGSYGQVEPYLARAKAALPEAEDGLRAEWYALQSNLLHVQGQAAEGIRAATRALELLDPAEVRLRGLAYLGLAGSYRGVGDYPHSSEAYLNAIQLSLQSGDTVGEILAVTALTLMAMQHGQLRFAYGVGSGALTRAAELGSAAPPITGAVYGAVGAILYEWNRTEEAQAALQRCQQLSALAGHNASVVHAKVLLARLQAMQGRAEAAERLIGEANELMQRGVPAWIRPEVTAQSVRLHLAQGNPAAAEALLAQNGVLLGQPLPPAIRHPLDVLYLAALRLLVATAQAGDQQALADGLALVERILEGAPQPSSTALSALVLRALLQQAQGHAGSAQESLAQALQWAEPEGYVRAFLDEGPPVLLLLQSLSKRPSPSGYAQLLLSQAALAQTPAPAAAQPPAQVGLIEPLSERELEVLRLIAQGLKYEEIAERLVVTVNTVRYHVKAVYGKLNANNKTQAVEAARQHGLL